MATIADLIVKIGADTSDLRKELNATKRQINRAFGSEAMEFSGKAAVALAGIGAGITGLGVMSIKAAGELQSVQTAFTNMLGSAEKSKAFIAEMQDFAAKTPFEFKDVSKAAQKFLAFGFAADQVIPTLTAVGDAAAGVGLGAEGVERVTLALGQMAAKSKVQAGEMLQLTETGIPAWQMLADKMGKSVSEVMDMVSKGQVSAAAGITALVSGMEERFSGMMDQQSQTILGTWSTLMDGIWQTGAAVGMKLAEALDITSVFQNMGDAFSNFAVVVQQSGLTEAFLTAIPPQFQIALAAIVTAITGLAIPAIALLVTKVALIAAPFIAAAAAAAPFIAAAAAIAAGLVFLYQQGVRAGDVINAMGINLDTAAGLGTAFKGMLSQLGRTLQALLTVLQPVLVLVGTALAAAFQAALTAIGFFINSLMVLATAVMEGITAILQTFQEMYEFIADVLNGIGSALGELADTVLPSWASSAISTISDFVSKAVGWLSDLIAKIFETNSALGSLGGEEGGEEGSGGGEKKEKKKFEVPNFSNLGSSKPAQKAGGGSGGGGGKSSSGGKGGGGRSLADDAKQTSKTIEDEWLRTFSTKTALVDRWYKEELAELDKSKAANEEYERDKQRLVELYGQKRLDALAEEKAREQEILNKARDAMMDVATARVSLYDSAAQQELGQMVLDYQKAIDSINDKWAKLSQEYLGMTDREKEAFLQSLDERGVAYKVTAENEISFEEAANEEKLAAFKDFEDQRTEYYAQCKDIQAEIDKAYRDLSLTELQAALDEESAIRMSNMEAEKSLMETYEEAYREAHATTMELVAEMASTSLSGLETAFTDILTGAKNAKQAFSDLGKSMVKTIASYFSQMLAGMIMTALFGKKKRGEEIGETQAAATVEAAALAPAAWLKLVLHPGAAGVATGLLTQGVGSSVGIGMAAASAGGSIGGAAAGGQVPKYANGGYFTRPMVGVLGDAGDEVALPLNKAVFENIGEGIQNAEEHEGGTSEVNTTLNNYGPINTAADLDELMEGMNAAVLAGLRGA